MPRSIWPCVVAALSVCWIVAAQDPIVTIPNGQIRGARKEYNLEVYDEFLGIPFAAPPVNELRWKKTERVEPWEGVLNATEYSAHCTHFIATLYPLIGMSARNGEDCLYLNIWVPRGVAENTAAPLPVMVWIYGGGYFLGTGEMYPGYDLALHGDVILVNFNYRLSSLGWLSTGDSAAVGNYGMWDIQMALTWVQENIAAFSGDPSRVTIFGHSAGGSLVSHAVLSPLMNNLFYSAIALSGSSTGYFGQTRQGLRSAAMLADFFNCTDVMTSDDLVTCLRDINPHALDFWGVIGCFNDGHLMNFAPVVDNDIVPYDPRESFELGFGNHINYITGNTYHDGAFLVILNPFGSPTLGDNSWAVTNESLNVGMELLLGLTSNSEEIMPAILAEYPEMVAEDNDTRTIATTWMVTDWWFGSGSTWEAQTRIGFPSANPTYRYLFQHRQSFLIGYPEWVNGSHIDDLYSVFGYPFMETYRSRYLGEDFDELDYEISDHIMNYLTNFAHTGDPNKGLASEPVHWAPFTSTQNHLHEAHTFSMADQDPERTQKYQFWMYDYPPLVEIPQDPTFPLPNRNVDRMTERDIDLAVERFRTHLHRQFGHSAEIRREVDQMIAGFVKDRKESNWYK